VVSEVQYPIVDTGYVLQVEIVTGLGEDFNITIDETSVQDIAIVECNKSY
jgi:hypothetical protein